MSSSARHSLGYVPEVTYGVTPATPTFTNWPHSSCSLALSKESAKSNTIRGDRQIRGHRHGVKQVGGDVTSAFVPLELDEILQIILMGTWTGTGPYVLSQGTVRRSISVMRRFTDQSAKPFHLIPGVELNTLAFGVTTKGVSFKVGCIGCDYITGATAPTGSTFSDPGNNDEFTGLSGSINEGGAAISTISEISFTVENGIEPRFTLMKDTTNTPKTGLCNITGSITSYFETAALLDKFIAGTSSDLDFSLTLGGFTYRFQIPHIKYNGGQPDVSEQADITLTLPFQASFDPTSGQSIIITKTTP